MGTEEDAKPESVGINGIEEESGNANDNASPNSNEESNVDTAIGKAKSQRPGAPGRLRIGNDFIVLGLDQREAALQRRLGIKLRQHPR